MNNKHLENQITRSIFFFYCIPLNQDQNKTTVMNLTKLDLSAKKKKNAIKEHRQVSSMFTVGDSYF